MKIKLGMGAYMPSRAHSTDAGLDLYACESVWIENGDSYIFDTGVHIELPDGTAGLIVSKSGLNVNHGLTSEGLIDVGYTGSIKVKLYNNGDHSYRICKGDKISQLVIVPVLTPDMEIVDELEDTERGSAGFGSTGR